MRDLLTRDLAGRPESGMGTAALKAFIADVVAFENYRVRHCYFIGTLAMPDSGADDREIACLADLSADRARELLDLIGGAELADEAWRAVVGREWRLVGIEGAPPFDGTSPTLTFNDDMTVAGNATSNRFTAGHVRDGFGVATSPIASTMMFNDNPPGAMEQERRFLALLQEAGSFVLDGQLLELYAGGRAVLAFE